MIVDATNIVADSTAKFPSGVYPASCAPVLITNTVTKNERIANASITAPATILPTRSPSTFFTLIFNSPQQTIE